MVSGVLPVPPTYILPTQIFLILVELSFFLLFKKKLLKMIGKLKELINKIKNLVFYNPKKLVFLISFLL